MNAPKKNFIEEYGNRYPDCKDHPHNTDLFSINSAEELYYPDGTFSPISMDRGLNEYYKESQKNGRRNIRATTEMVWAVEAIPGVEHLMVYESRLNYFIPGKPWISICLYNITKFSGSTVMKVLQTHPYTISNGIITQNPYFEDPDEWLKKNAPEFTIK
ncbi:MAG: MEDS domain-containing protein [Melioribacteraceae bacterium]|nr:MEDS domain-containing protein [Melioribacteraceae bacterium]